MDKQTLQKLKLMLSGIVYRLNEEADYFQGLEGEFKSGTRIFPLKCNLTENGLSINFEGRKISAGAEELPEILADFAARFEKVTLVYRARGEALVIEADKTVTMKTRYLEEEKEEALHAHAETGLITNRNYLIRPGKADALLKAIGIMAENGKIKNDMIRKYNQTDHFVELLEPMLKELSKGRPELKIVDCACGKSYLSFVLNYYLREVMRINCRFMGIDISESVVESSRKIARQLNYNNMDFMVGDIRTLLYRDEEGIDSRPDLVVSLHACDVATDYAIAYGIRNRSRGIVVVPCCHSELLNQYHYEPFKDIIKHGIFKARLADVLTDGIRCMILEAFGYTVSAVEYVSPLDTPKNLLIRAVFTGRFDRAKYESCRKLAGMLGAEPMLLRQTAGL